MGIPRLSASNIVAARNRYLVLLSAFVSDARVLVPRYKVKLSSASPLTMAPERFDQFDS